jgi:hypothetical protein
VAALHFFVGQQRLQLGVFVGTMACKAFNSLLRRKSERATLPGKISMGVNQWAVHQGGYDSGKWGGIVGDCRANCGGARPQLGRGNQAALVLSVKSRFSSRASSLVLKAPASCNFSISYQCFEVIFWNQPFRGYSKGRACYKNQ